MSGDRLDTRPYRESFTNYFGTFTTGKWDVRNVAQIKEGLAPRYVWICRVADIPKKYWSITSRYWVMDNTQPPLYFSGFFLGAEHFDNRNIGSGTKDSNYVWCCIPIEFAPSDIENKEEWGEVSY